MRRASSTSENDPQQTQKSSLRTTSKSSNGGAVTAGMSLTRRNAGWFLLLAIPLFLFYLVTSYGYSSSNDDDNNNSNTKSKMNVKASGSSIAQKQKVTIVQTKKEKEEERKSQQHQHPHQQLRNKNNNHDSPLFVPAHILDKQTRPPLFIPATPPKKKKDDAAPPALADVAAVQEEKQQQSSSLTGTADDPCTIWLAPSSILGNPGYGLFTTRNISKGQAVLGGPDGLSIPIEDGWYRPGEWGKKKKRWIHLWNKYWWGKGVPDHVRFEGSPGTPDYQIGFGAMPNHHCLLKSLKHQYPEKAPYQDSVVNRFKDVGAGAFSYSRGREFTVVRDVDAGDELFLSYGYCEHDDSVPSWTENIFMTPDFDEAARLVSKQVAHPDRGVLFTKDSDELIVPPNTTSLVAALLPQNRKEFEHIQSNVDTSDLKALALFLAVYKGLNAKTVEDIRRDGMCMERMKPGTSTIPQAGQGGFAQFPIRKDEMIVPSPVLHIMDKDVLALFDTSTDQRIGMQLLINYCMSHTESSVLLCPDTNALLINHCSTRMKDWEQYCPNGPNAKVRWASGWDSTSDKWRQMSLDELDQQQARGLALEIIALRDIQPNEEVFFDYGPEWEEAWQAHVATWKPPAETARLNAETWISAEEANQLPSAPIMDNLISHDLRKTKKHDYLLTACQYKPGHEDMKKAYRIPAGGNATHTETSETAPVDWVDLSDKEILGTYSDDGSRFVYRGNGYQNHRDYSHWPCAVLLPENDEGGNTNLTYTVRILASPRRKREKDTQIQPWEESDVPRILTNYPRDSIHYFVVPYQSDQHLPGVFRHPMGFPKEHFPEQWKNLKHRHLRRHFR